MKKVVLISALIGMFLSGCSHRIADLTYVSTKNITQEELATATSDNERVTGEDSSHIIIFIPTGNPSAEEALDRAIEKRKGGVALKNATLHSSWFYIPYIYGKSTITVEGEVLVPLKKENDK
tara:strand:- start:48 stop:413 length:366 start_codon:yes stop_codon:yes gene_type:complete